jgi:hypothetical protein
MSLGHGASIVRDGLVLHLDAANSKSYSGSGTVWSDLSGNSINASLSATDTSFVSENNGTIYFNTGISSINGPSTPNAFTSFTAFKKIGVQTSNYHVLLGGQTHEISIQSNSTLRVGTNTNTSSRTILDVPSSMSEVDLLDGIWHIITSRYDGATIKSYIDSLEVGSAVKTGITNNTYKLSKIGCWENNSYQANGYIPFVVMYNRGLSEEEIKQNFEALRGRYGI